MGDADAVREGRDADDTGPADAVEDSTSRARASRRRWHLAAAALAVASLVVLLGTTPALDAVASNATALVRLVAAYGLLLGTSGFVVTAALRFAGAEPTEDVADTGRAVGKIENVLVLTLTLLGAYTALAIVFTAKSIVRWQDLTSENTTYYLTGSIANVTYTFVYGLAAAQVLGLSAG